MMIGYELLKSNALPLDIEMHSDPLCMLPVALSKKRAFKPNKITQEDNKDNAGGVAGCRFCNPNLLDGEPELVYHLDHRVISFPNVAPFLPGDQRVLCLWNDSQDKRYEHVHRYQFADFGIEEFYFLTRAAAELAKAFPGTKDGRILQEDINPIRCIAGFNIGKLAGQSIPHFHLQYGWEIVLNPRNISSPKLALYYWEIRDAKLILYEDNDLYMIVPWTPKGQYHVELHFKEKYEIGQLEEKDVRKIATFCRKILDLYQVAGVRNVNIFFSGSPMAKHWEPLRVQFVPRVNITALYEMIGVNVVDTPPETITTFFQNGIRWSDVEKEYASLNFDQLYEARFNETTAKCP